MYQESTNQETWYFFCVTGINITGKLLECFKQNPVPFALDQFLLIHLNEIKTEENFTGVVNHLYFQTFTLFNDMWVKGRPTNIMNFTQFFDDVFQIRFKNQIRDSLQLYFKNVATSKVVVETKKQANLANKPEPRHDKKT